MKPRLSKECAEALDALALDMLSDVELERHSKHREECPNCKASEQDLIWLHRTVLQTGDEIDDLTRARILAQLKPTIEAATGTLPKKPIWERRYFQLMMPAAAVAMTLLVVGLVLHFGSMQRAHKEAQSVATKDRESSDTQLLVPYALERGRAPWAGASHTLGHKLNRLQIPIGSQVRARLAHKATIALLGPADLEVKHAAPNHITLRLTRGILIAEYDRKQGGHLEIVAPGSVTEIVGTLFLIEAQGESSTVSVAHGQVRVRRGAGEALVDKEESWSSEEGLRKQSQREVKLFRQFENQSNKEKLVAEAGLDRFSERKANDTNSPGGSQSEAASLRQGALQLDKPRERSAKSGMAKNSSPSSSQANEASSKESTSLFETKGLPEPQAEKPNASTTPKPIQRLSSEDLYQRAELAMRERNLRSAQKLLEELMHHYSRDPLATQARYELAHLAFKAGDLREASRHVEAILQGSVDSRLVEPARYLQCRIEIRRGTRQNAENCLISFRRQYPKSPHDEAALGMLIGLTRGDCKQNKRLIQEYLERYPQGSFTDEARRRSETCRP